MIPYMTKTPEAKFQDSQWKPLTEANQANQIIADAVGPGSVLDLGCGDGTLLALLAKRGIGGVGLDLSEKAVAIAHERGLDCRVHDLTEPLPFPDKSFDAVLIIDVLEHLYRPDQLLTEAARVAVQYVYISTPNFASLPARLQVLRGRVPENNTPRDGHIYWMTEQVVTHLTKGAGLVLDTAWDNTFWQNRPVVGPLMRALVRAWPSLFALAFIRRYRLS